MKNFREYIKGNDKAETPETAKLEDLTMLTMPNPAINQSNEELTPKQIAAKKRTTPTDDKNKADRLKQKLNQYRNAPGGTNTPNYRAAERELRGMQYGK